MALWVRVEIRPHKIMPVAEVVDISAVEGAEQEVVAGAEEARLQLGKSALILREPALVLDQLQFLHFVGQEHTTQYLIQRAICALLENTLKQLGQIHLQPARDAPWVILLLLPAQHRAPYPSLARPLRPFSRVVFETTRCLQQGQLMS